MDDATFQAVKIPDLSDHEIIQLIIDHYCPPQELPMLATRLLERFGCLNGILKASAVELKQVVGIDEILAVHIAQLVPIFNESRRRAALAMITLEGPEATIEFAKTLPQENQHECVWLILLDGMLRIIRHFMVYEGGTCGVHFDLQHIVRMAVINSATNAIIVHNHPANEPRPTPEDIRATIQVGNALEAAGISLVDHIIVTEESAFSFAENGMLIKLAESQMPPAMPLPAQA